MNNHKKIISELFVKSTFPPDAFYIDQTLQERKLIIYGAGEGFHWVDEIIMKIYGYTPALVLDRRFGPEGQPKGRRIPTEVRQPFE